MSYEYSEDGLVENAAHDVLHALGWRVITAWKNEKNAALLGRESKSDVLLKRPLLEALERLNPGIPENACLQAYETLAQRVADRTTARINKDKYALLRDGIPVSFQNGKGELVKTRLRAFDFGDPESNEFLAVRQFEIYGELYNRRADIVGFVNGVPLVFFELKAHHTDLRNAYTDNLTDYKETVPHLFYTNAFIILSNGTETRVGTITSPYKFFNEWKRIEEDEEGIVSLDTVLRGTCDKARLMDIFENFLLYDDVGGEVTKIMAKNHQFIGVNKVLANARNIESLAGKLGVFWHTQGSGKSYSMVFLSEKFHRTIGGGYTFVIVVDRSELENQIYDTYSGVGALHEANVKARSREELRRLLGENHRYIFTLIHKFSIDPKKESEYPLLTERKNIIVISDEAHRTQAGTYARNMRFHAIPNASYIGFTGTPIIKDELELTKNIFGEYVSVYDFKKAIDDGATLPLRYLNRGEKLGIENPKLDEKMAALIESEDLDADQRRKLAREFSRDYPILTAPKRLDAIARDIVWHFNDRGYQGKAMLVALDKPTAVKMFDLIMGYWPQYLADLQRRIDAAEDEQEELELRRRYENVKACEVCVVVSAEQNEKENFRELGLDIEPHRRKMVERDLETEFKDENHPFRLAIVCAMWITGFDAPCISTLYLDKPIKGHTLMQTIARANRVYDDEKENGLIVDYGNVYKKLEEAYSIYGEGGDRAKGGGSGDSSGRPVEELAELAGELQKAINDVTEHLQELGFDLQTLMDAKPIEKLALINQAMNAIKLNETTRVTFETKTRAVFRKYKALYPEEEVKPFVRSFNAIEAIYNGLNKNVKTANITSVILALQNEVNESILIHPMEDDGAEIDLGMLDFDALRRAFAKSDTKQQAVYDLQLAIDRKLQQMIKRNPVRLEFYEKYQKIIDEYNRGKDAAAAQKAFDELSELMKSMGEEESRAVRENLDEETLAIFDLLKKEDLNAEEKEKVKEVAKKTLETLKAEQLRIAMWHESTQIKARVKTTIHDMLLYLPQEKYPDEEVDERSMAVYMHIYSNYQHMSA